MALTYKVRYKNHCTPQEQILTDGRWYLDSDCGRKLTGNSETSRTIGGAGFFSLNLAITDSPSLFNYSTPSPDFVFIKNTGRGSGDDVLITLDNSNYLILLSSNEAFASEVDASSTVRVKCADGEDSTISYFITN
jgi:hypothetical protein